MDLNCINAVDFGNNVSGEMDYRKYVVKTHISVKESEHSKKVILMDKPDYFEQYKKYPYFKNSYLNGMLTGYCVGYNVPTSIPNKYGYREQFMPIYTEKTGKQRIILNIHFKQEYGKYLKSVEIKKMWKTLFSLMTIKIPKKISFCSKIIETEMNLPIEIAHIIYQFARDTKAVK